MRLTRIILPYPPKELSPNRQNGHKWGATNKVKAKYRHDCWASALERVGTGCLLPSGDIPLKLTFIWSGVRPDSDNILAAAKSGIDGLADALKINDNRFEPLIVERREIIDTELKYPALIVELACQPSR